VKHPHETVLQRLVPLHRVSARSILAETILNQKGKPNFRAFSAGSHPTRRVNPHAIHRPAHFRIAQ